MDVFREFVFISFTPVPFSHYNFGIAPVLPILKKIRFGLNKL
jgi:hypothetical protein